MTALDMIAGLEVQLLVIVSLMRIPHTPFWNSVSVDPEQVTELIAKTPLRLPETEISLGCARQRGSLRLETLAVDAGVNRLALPPQAARASRLFNWIPAKSCLRRFQAGKQLRE